MPLSFRLPIRRTWLNGGSPFRMENLRQVCHCFSDSSSSLTGERKRKAKANHTCIRGYMDTGLTLASCFDDVSDHSKWQSILRERLCQVPTPSRLTSDRLLKRESYHLYDVSWSTDGQWGRPNLIDMFVYAPLSRRAEV